MKSLWKALLASALALILTGTTFAQQQGEAGGAGTDDTVTDDTVTTDGNGDGGNGNGDDGGNGDGDGDGGNGDGGKGDSGEPPEKQLGTIVAFLFKVEGSTETQIWKSGIEVDSGSLEAIKQTDIEQAHLTEVRIRTEDGEIRGVPDDTIRQWVRKRDLRPGTGVGFTAVEGDAETTVSVLRQIPSGGRRFLSLLAPVAFLLLFTRLLLQDRAKRLLIGEDGRYSNSKFQIVLWFTVLIGVYVGTLLLRWWGSFGELIGGIDIPTNLLVLSGLSALTFAGAKGIKQGKVADAEARHQQAQRHANLAAANHAAVDSPQLTAQATGQQDPTLKLQAASLQAKAQDADAEVERTKKVVDSLKPETDDAKARFPADLIQDDNGIPDLGDFQMLVVTLLAVGTYLWTTLAWQGGPQLVETGIVLPNVDTTILATFGLGHGAYLTKKYVEAPAPANGD